MTIKEARQICREYYELTNPKEEDDFVYTEALKYLIEETKEADYMVELGAFYYGKRQFDLALKYYDLAAESGNLYAISDLGYIWYYGRTGEKNYEKAFYYFDKARRMGDTVAEYKVADMYKNGYYVQKDYGKYKEMIEGLYPKVSNATRLDEPLPEVYTRLAQIRTEEGNTEEALRLYMIARDFLAQRIRINPFFGNLNIMKWMIEDIYRISDVDEEFMDLYDLYHFLESPCKISFFFEDKEHIVESSVEEGGIAIKFDDKWYRDVDDFFKKAEIDGELLTTIYDELYDFEVK